MDISANRHALKSLYSFLSFSVGMQMWHCMASYCKKVAHCSGYKSVQSGSEADLLDALYTVGPLRFTHTCV